jgi:hypothetical protein
MQLLHEMELHLHCWYICCATQIQWWSVNKHTPRCMTNSVTALQGKLIFLHSFLHKKWIENELPPNLLTKIEQCWHVILSKSIADHNEWINQKAMLLEFNECPENTTPWITINILPCSTGWARIGWLEVMDTSMASLHPKNCGPHITCRLLFTPHTAHFRQSCNFQESCCEGNKGHGCWMSRGKIGCWVYLGIRRWFLEDDRNDSKSLFKARTEVVKSIKTTSVPS